MTSAPLPAVPGAPSPAQRTLTALLRSFGLIGLADQARRSALTRREAADNAAFLLENPDFAAPPLGHVYEVTGRPSYRAFAASGRAACESLATLADAHLDRPLARVLDWGVGPARVARWWPTMRPGVDVHGADPWPDAIDWGRGALPSVTFHRLPELPPTTLPGESFDLVYGISILTHLSLPAQRAWLAELKRILRPGGLAALTLQSEAALARLTPAERAEWREGRMVERAQVRHGSRLYLAYHPPGFARRDLFAEWEIVAHEPLSIVGSGGQDLWLLRRAA